MTTMHERTSAQRHDGQRGLAVVVLLAAIAEVVAPVVTINGPGSSPGAGSGPELLITPVGWAFSIWGVIYTLAIAQSVAVLVRGAHAVPRRLQVDLTVLYLGGAVWIVLAGLDSSLATAVDAGLVEADELPWQLVVLAVAAVVLLAVLVRTGGIVAYAAAGTWAMVGIAVTGNADGTTGVLVAALVAAAVIVVVTAALVARRPADA
ncbi:MAG: hypothetical protein EON53_09095 [Actinomycetales bacterium]|nr:MAG: hypothetical protein EON53_09095 [Actinomycetales bacterium]